MKKDADVQLLLRERQKGRTQVQAAARAGMSERTARKYEQAGALPSQLKRPRSHRTRPDPFADDWPWIVEQLERDNALQAKFSAERPDEPWQARQAAWNATYPD